MSESQLFPAGNSYRLFEEAIYYDMEETGAIQQTWVPFFTLLYDLEFPYLNPSSPIYR